MNLPEEITTGISVHTELAVPELPDTDRLVAWITEVINREGRQLERVVINLVDDNDLHTLNGKYLQHDTLTDILTFPYSYHPVNTELIISIDRTRDNARALGVTPAEELSRVIIHGILHMCGWDDTTEELREKMRRKEEECLQLLKQI